MTVSREEWVATIHPEDLEAMVVELGAAIDGGLAPTNPNTAACCRAARCAGWRAAARCCNGADGHAVRVVGTLSDVTAAQASWKRSCAMPPSRSNIAQAAAGLATFDFNFAPQQPALLR